MKTKIYPIILLIICMVTSCANDNSPEIPVTPRPSLTVGERSALPKLVDFDIDFIEASCVDSKNENIVVAPFSAGMVLSMLANVADEATAMQITEAIGCNDVESLNSLTNKYMNWLPCADKKVSISLANSIWYHDEYTISPLFAATAQEYYSSQIFGRNFDDSKAVVADINERISQKTNGLIKNIMSEILPRHYFLIANALYFKGAWASPFNISDTSKEKFNGFSKTTFVDMMKNKHSFIYGESDDFQVVQLPFGNLSMQAVIVLPASGIDIEEFIASGRLRNAVSEEAFSGLYNVTLSLPKFKLSNDENIDLRKIFARLGVTNLKEVQSINLFEENVYTAIETCQKSTVEFNEDGAVASSSSWANGEVTLAPPINKDIVMTVDRPFIFLIRDTMTGVCLFAGKVANL